MAGFCDLHLHSTASDGTDGPGDLAKLCRAAGLDAFALTDHDTTAGLAEAAAAARREKIGFVPGIELSADPDLAGTGVSRGTLHLLGYFIDADSPGLAELTARIHRARERRNPEIVERLDGLGVRISYDEVVSLARSLSPGRDPVVGRPHIAQVLVDKGYVKSIHEAFSRYLGAGGAAHVRRDRLSAAEAIQTLHAAGGLVSMAHPVQLKLADDAALERAVATLRDLGLDAIETRHSDHTPADVRRFDQLAERFGLLTTGGSDYHGSRKSVPLNQQRVSIAVYDRLRRAVDKPSATPSE
ncbi:MAG: PHP domain-containing protein [Planctomycetota bacterium]